MRVAAVSEPQVTEVTECDDCPFLAEGCYCLAPGVPDGKGSIWADKEQWGALALPPPWCPLMVASRLVVLKPKAKP